MQSLTLVELEVLTRVDDVEPANPEENDSPEQQRDRSHLAP